MATWPPARPIFHGRFRVFVPPQFSTSMHPLESSLGEHAVIDRVRPYVEQNEIAGAVTLIAQNGRIREFEATGLADLKTKRPMTRDTLFWVASMTKPIIAAAILMLEDEGKLSVDDSIAKHLEEFKEMWVIAEKTDDRMVLQRSTPPTLRQLLAHTDGLVDVALPHLGTPLAEWVASVSRQPLQFEPGSRWAYNNAGLNALGRIVEVVSGQPLPEFLQQRFFGPLGMKETTFILSRDQYRRLAVSYKYDAEKKRLKPIPIFLFRAKPTSKKITICPGGGLFSTAADMFLFYQMFCDGGTSQGRRYLSERAFKEMTTRQTGELKTGFTEGMCFGLGVGMVREPTGLTAALSPGTFGHGGAYGTQSWVDPVRHSVSIFMCQRSNFNPNPDASDLRQVYNEAVAQLLSAPPV
jgi:CubicO group peptidase (beta-lactamase class C family)